MVQYFYLIKLFLNNLEQFAKWADFPWIRASSLLITNIIGLNFLGFGRNGLYFLQHFGRLSYASGLQSEALRNQVSAGVSVPCWHATPVANAP